MDETAEILRDQRRISDEHRRYISQFVGRVPIDYGPLVSSGMYSGGGM